VERDVGYFNIIMWIHVSQNFTVEAVTSEMFEAASGKGCNKVRNLGVLQTELMKELKGKKFLLVLDDFWKTDVTMLDTLLAPLTAGDSGSKILVTTRFEDVAKALLGAQNLFPIPEIEEDQFIKMFMHYALDGAKNSGQEFREHEIVGIEIAQKLRGSPMAARLVAEQLRGNLNIDHWTMTLDSDLLKDTMGAIWWSYQQLEEHVRQCFRYCIMFPRRYQLEREELVHLWMAEGFLEAASEAKNMENIGHACFDDLLSRSFIQPKEHSNDMRYFTIHDLFHDLLEDWRPDINVSRHVGSEYYRIEEGIVSEIPEPDQVRHLFIESYNEIVFQEKILKLKNLRTIFMSATTETMTKKDLKLLFKSLRKLRVIHVYYKDYKDRKEVPKIGDLKHLRYLSLWPDDDDFYEWTLRPYEFTKLYHLQKFYCSSPWVLHPSSHEEMCSLVNLRYMSELDKFEIPNIGRLTLLRTLGAFTVRKASGYEIQQLEHLDILRGTLEIKGLENVRSKEEARQAKLGKKVHLRKLKLQWQTDNQSSEENKDVRKSKKHRTISCLGDGPSRSTNQILDPQEEVLEELCPPSLTSELKIEGYGGSSYPSWLSEDQGKLKNLQHLQFSRCSASGPPSKICTLNLPSLTILDCSWSSLPENIECLASLEELSISNCENMLSLPRLPMSLKVLKICNWKGTDPCPWIWESLVNLCKLRLYYVSWTSLPENMECLASLEEMEINRCQNMLLLPRLPMSLKELTINRWKGTYVNPGSWESLVNLCKLRLCHCSWTSLPENMERLTSLKVLSITNCKNILSLPRLPLSIKVLYLEGWDETPGVGEPLRTIPSWPENMEDLTSLEKVVMTNCNNIHSLPNLPRSLKEFLLNGEDLMRDDCSWPAASI